MKDKCFFNLENPLNLLKDRLIVVVNKVATQYNKGLPVSNNFRLNDKPLLCYICGRTEHKAYFCPHKDEAHVMFRNRQTQIPNEPMTIPRIKETNVYMVLAYMVLPLGVRFQRRWS